MKIDNLIKAVVSSIVTHNRGTVTLRQRNIMSRLTAYDHSRESRSIDNATAELRFRKTTLADTRNHLLPVGSWLIRNLNELLFFVWGWLVYKLPVRIRRLWDKSTPNGYYAANPRLNFWLLSLMICFIILCVGYCVQFFINDMLLFSQSPYSNSRGALVFERPLHRTHHVYLFNTSEYWRDTGIDLAKGDNVYITASGAFFSNIAMQFNTADSNVMTDSMPLINIKTTDLAKTSYRPSTAMKKARVKPDEEYGAVLYSITSEIRNVDDIASKDGVKSLRFDTDGPVSFVAEKSGRLKISINDIFFSDENIDRLLADEEALGRISNKFAYLADSCRSTDISGTSLLRQRLKDNRELWFRDNNGEILLNIIVEHSLLGASEASLSNRIVSGIFRPINNLVDPPVEDSFDSTNLMVVLSLTLLFVTDAVTGIILRRRHGR